MAESKKREMSDGLLRQRRNLLIISLTIIFFLYSEVEISKISVLGIEIITPKQNALMNILWVLWAYFFLRFLQYLQVENSRGYIEQCKVKFQFLASDIAHKMLETAKKYESNRSCGIVLNDLKLRFFMKLEVPQNEYNPESGEVENLENLETKHGSMLIVFAKAIWATTINTPKFTDNVLPILLALAAVTYGIVKHHISP